MNYTIHWFGSRKLAANHHVVVNYQFAGIFSTNGGGTLTGPHGKAYILTKVEKTKSTLTFTMQAEGENETVDCFFESKVEGFWIGGKKTLNNQEKFSCTIKEFD